MHAWMEGRLSDDIVAEQRKVEEAELVIFQVRGHTQRHKEYHKTGHQSPVISYRAERSHLDVYTPLNHRIRPGLG